MLSGNQPQRPDPDLLVRQLKEDSERASRGRLRVYFGASAGVGKTYAMLSAAQRLQKEGGQVLVGVVETHGRSDTAALQAGLTQLPLRQVAYRGRSLSEFDLDAALAARPQDGSSLKPLVLLVDELAHSNVEGSRHPKRWQDVEELLDAGIDVWTAMNVQHLESLNGIVGAITGIRVHETVPDTVLEAADEMVLIDVTPDELLARLASGKVYLPQQAERAARNFFKKGNLIALREIALRRTAEHVEDDVRSWRVQSAGQDAADASGGAWNTSGAILACVGHHEGAEQAVRTAARLAGQLNVQWHAVHVETPRLAALPAATRDRVLAVLQLARQMGAETAVVSSGDAAVALAAEARRRNCALLVLGRPVGSKSSVQALLRRFLPPVLLGGADGQRGGIRQRIARIAPALDLLEAAPAASSRSLQVALGAAALAGSGHAASVLASASTSASASASHAADSSVTAQPGNPGPASLATAAQGFEATPGEAGQVWRGYLWAVVCCAIIAALARPLSGALELSNIVMLFLLGVLGIAMRWGRGPSAFAALLNVLVFDFFFVAPRYSFTVSDAQYLVTFAVMLVVGITAGQLTAGLRYQARIAAAREERAQALFALSRDLSGALQDEQVAALGATAVCQTFGGEAVVLLTAPVDARLTVPQGGPRLVMPANPPAGLDASVADWAFRNGQSAGLATTTLAGHAWHYVPLRAPMQIRGVLALRPAEPRWLLIPEQMQQLQTLARQIAIALERVHYVQVAQGALVDMESERLRNALLAALSHDVRTPLTALIGLAETLRASTPALSDAQAGTADKVVRQAQELNALVHNLLDMARLQSGGVHLRSDWQSVEEMAGSAIRAAGAALQGCLVQTMIPAALPLVECDAQLMERVLVNLLENAVRHGSPPITLSAAAADRTLAITVRDHGPGLPQAPQGQTAHLFDKFTRGHAESAVPGIGLGLAIVRAIVEAHGGDVKAATARDGRGGAEFTVTLPLRPAPRLSESPDLADVNNATEAPEAIESIGATYATDAMGTIVSPSAQLPP